jgi:BNR repeat-like domain
MKLRVFAQFAVSTAIFRLRFPTDAEEPQLHRSGAALPPGLAQVSSQNPFHESCNASQVGVNFHNGAVEPFVTVDPSNPDHIIGVWQQDRWADGGSSGLMTGVSMDRGRTWATTFAAFSNCSGLASYNRASDPWVAISPNGVAYQIALSLADSNNTSAVLVSRSADGGFTWGNPVTLIRDTAATTGFNDKEAITADPTDSNYVYAVWDRSSSPPNIRPAYFARSTDGGISWETAHSIYNPGTSSAVTLDQILVLPDGTLVNVFVFYRNSPIIEVIRSLDHGATWSAPTVVAADETIGTVNAKTQKAIRSGAGIPNASVDSTTGAIYITWADARFSASKRDGIALAKSLDGGLTWSEPVQVNQATNVQAFTQAVAAGAGGVAVAYFDFRKDTPNPNTLLTNAWRVVSADGGATWRESPVFGPFDLNSAPLTTEGNFIGDYQGFVAAGGDFLAFFAAASPGNPANPSSIFATSTEQTGDRRSNDRIEINLHPRPYKPETIQDPTRNAA